MVRRMICDLELTRSFLDAVFKEFNISKGSAAIPDVASHIEKTVDDANAQVPLSAEAYARFRRALGKLLWMAQVRHDIKILPQPNWVTASGADVRDRICNSSNPAVSIQRHEHNVVYSQSRIL